jgi:hypothetical protein
MLVGRSKKDAKRLEKAMKRMDRRAEGLRRAGDVQRRRKGNGRGKSKEKTKKAQKNSNRVPTRSDEQALKQSSF